MLRRRLGFYFDLYPRNVRTPDLVAFVRGLHRQLRRPLLLVLDRWSVHRAAVRELARTRPAWLVAVAWLPAYAPDLNPVEQVWNHTKHGELANSLPQDLGGLSDEVGISLASKRWQPALLRSCFRYAKLKL